MQQNPSNRTPLLFGKFRLIDCLKKDVCSAVYLAHHVYLDKEIVLKILNTNELADKSRLERFKREAQILAKLDHPNIIKVLDFGVFENFFYISFEHFESRSLREWLAENRLAPVEKEKLLIQLARALHAAHESQVIHRDIKPENILVNRDRHLKIADFGLALALNETSLTHKATIVGTPSYMSPEQIRGEKLTAQSDLFALGIVAFELFAGCNPFLGKNLNETFNNILLKSGYELLQTAAKVPEKIRLVIEKLLQHDCKLRLTSALEVLAFLDAEVGRPRREIHNKQPARRGPSTKLWVVAVTVLFMLILSLQLLRITNPSDAKRISQVSLAPEHVSRIDSVAQNSVMRDSSSLVSVKPPNHSRAKKPQVTAVSESLGATTLATLGRLDIQCLPWADVYLDSEKVDTTPLKKPLTLPTGQYRLSLQHPQYPIYSRFILIRPETITTVQVDLDTLFGYLDCQIYPWGDVYVDSQYAGQTPLQKPIILQRGIHLLTIRNPNYPEVREEIFIAKRDTLRYRHRFAAE